MWFGYNTLIIFSRFFCVVNLVYFWYEMLSKCIDSGYLVGAILLTVFHQWLKLCRCFLHGMKMCMWFWYNLLIFFSLCLQFSGNNLSFSSDSAVAGL